MVSLGVHPGFRINRLSSILTYISGVFREKNHLWCATNKIIHKRIDGDGVMFYD